MHNQQPFISRGQDINPSGNTWEAEWWIFFTRAQSGIIDRRGRLALDISWREEATFVVAWQKVHHSFSEFVLRPDKQPLVPLHVYPWKTRSRAPRCPPSGIESERDGLVTWRHWPSCSKDKTLLHASTSDSRAVISGDERARLPLRMSTPNVGPRRTRLRTKGKKRKTTPPSAHPSSWQQDVWWHEGT